MKKTPTLDFLLVILSTLFFNACYGENNIDLSGKWKNTRGSILEIEQDNDGNISGTFKTAVSSTKQCIGFPAIVKGFVNDNVIAVTIDMRKCGSQSVLSLVGSVDETSGILQTTALILKHGKDEWNNKNICNDIFSRMTE